MSHDQDTHPENPNSRAAVIRQLLHEFEDNKMTEGQFSALGMLCADSIIADDLAALMVFRDEGHISGFPSAREEAAYATILEIGDDAAKRMGLDDQITKMRADQEGMKEFVDGLALNPDEHSFSRVNAILIDALRDHDAESIYKINKAAHRGFDILVSRKSDDIAKLGKYLGIIHVAHNGASRIIPEVEPYLEGVLNAVHEELKENRVVTREELDDAEYSLLRGGFLVTRRIGNKLYVELSARGKERLKRSGYIE